MKPEYKPFVDALIELAIREDIGDGDHTSLCCIPATEKGRMRLLCKQEGILAGIEIAQLVLRRLDLCAQRLLFSSQSGICPEKAGLYDRDRP